MQFIYPIGFFALASILVPILLHLWNVQQGKTLKIGSIIFLGEIAHQSAKSFKITDWLLLLLRCFLLMIMSFLLAQPFLNQLPVESTNKGWLLLKKSQLSGIYHQHQKTIDSLLQKGFEIHDFDIHFKTLTLKDSSQNFTQTPTDISDAGLINQLNGMLSGGFKIYLFTDLRLSKQEENLPATHLNLKIINLAADSNIRSKVVSAYFSKLDSIKVLIGKYNAASTSYELKSLKVDTKEIQLKIDSGISYVKTKSQKQWIKVEDAPLKITVFDDGNKDSEYLLAALKAIKDFTQRKISIQILKNAGSYDPQTDFLFWLSPKPIPENIKLKTGASIFTYESGKIENNRTIIKNGNDFPLADLYQNISNPNPKEKSIWTDGFGTPVLSFSNQNSILQYHFYSRFSPQCTNLVWKEDFVKALLPIVLATTEKDQIFGFEPDSADIRVLDKSQPVFLQAAQNTPAEKVSEQNSIANWFWWLAFFMLFLERVLTFIQKKS